MTREVEPSILDLQRVRLSAEASNLSFDLALSAGDFVLLDCETDDQEEEFVNVALGLQEPMAGAVEFSGHRWSEVSADYAAALRGHIGFVPRADTWVSYLPTADNILLAARYHTTASGTSLQDRGLAWCTRFSLPGLPLDLPQRLPEIDRLRASLVRAFVGDPILVVLESQNMMWDPEVLTPLVDALQALRERGGAVFWCLGRDELFYDPTLPANARYRVRGRNLVRWGTDGA